MPLCLCSLLFTVTLSLLQSGLDIGSSDGLYSEALMATTDDFPLFLCLTKYRSFAVGITRVPQHTHLT